MAMATPGNVSDTSLRDMANAPASPVNRAIKRSIIPGDVLTMIWFILLGWMAPDSGNVKKNATTMAVTIPPILKSNEFFIAGLSPALIL